MPSVDIDRGWKLDKIHTKRMLHAFAQLCLELIGLEDERVNDVLRHKGITLMPGPVVGLEYGMGDKQVHEADLVLAEKEVEALERVRKPISTKKKTKR